MRADLENLGHSGNELNSPSGSGSCPSQSDQTDQIVNHSSDGLSELSQKNKYAAYGKFQKVEKLLLSAASGLWTWRMGLRVFASMLWFLVAVLILPQVWVEGSVDFDLLFPANRQLTVCPAASLAT
ncbi:hypothetical protein P4O66_014140 [Electrophorus voltai]|uniref:Uncharacterized protein n=1 Tax=Electrophorus voltai TaxID=2609070 RepID=A0AAD9DR85_9TELE|nr:hypothetical protein P4O66_014140 [Electrophorus voltai]